MKHIDIWTDGASRGNPGIGGYGIVLKYLDNNKVEHIRELKDAFEMTTNNRMELLSVIIALKELKEPCEVNIISDSKYVVNAFNENWIDDWIKSDFRKGTKNEVKNIDLWEELIKHSKIHKITFHWVKGHSDNVENERCDKLANMAMDELIENKLK